jgi:hypothetical protein
VFLVRYFLYVGAALLALVFLADWYWPAVSTTAASGDQAQETSIDREILRIQSAQKWPQKIVFDTNVPTIVPPPALVASVAPVPPSPLRAAEALNKSVLNAHAEAKPAVQAQTPQRKVARHRTYKPAAPPQFGPYPVASAWSPWW